MVSNIHSVLDEGEIKYLPECIPMGYDKNVWKMICDEWDPEEYNGVQAALVSESMRPWMCQDYCRRNGITPFIPFLTFNVSPNWKLRPSLGHHWNSKKEYGTKILLKTLEKL